MKIVDLNYNPYEMKTQMSIDSQNICEIKEYPRFKEFIESDTPIQTWLEPIDYKNWKGILNEIIPDDDNESVTFNFSGRKIEFDDLKRACKSQNECRKDDCKINATFNHIKVIDDIELSENVEAVYKALLSKRFRNLVTDESGDSKSRRYKKLKENYEFAKNKDFQIVFSGIYSSGKSTIINALIKHRILPSGNNTCTANNCEIRHTPSLGNKVSLEAVDENGKVVFDKTIYENDDDFRNQFSEISSLDDKASDSPYISVDKLIVGVDLSHLYPEQGREEIEEKFTIVIIDTPGVNSSATQYEEINEHAVTALEAITDKSKPMVIFCVDSGSLEDESIGTFLKDINERTENDGNKFNERFLFLANKCDDIENDNDDDDVLKTAKAKFSDYLTTPSKWGMPEKTHIGFEPRMFFTASLASLAIAIGMTETEKDPSRKKVIFRNYEDFKDSIIKYKDSNYFLTNECSIPEYRKEQITEEFNNCLKNNDEVRAVELQTGIPALVIAIQDYILRYAYPIRVKALMNTYDDILIDVRATVSRLHAELDDALKSLDENEEKKERSIEEKKTKEKEEKNLSEVNKKIDEAKEKLNNLASENWAFNVLSRDFDKAINYLVEENIPRDDLIIKSETEQENAIKEAQKKKSCFTASFLNTCDKYSKDLNKAIKEQSDTLEEIVSILKDVVDEIKSCKLSFGGKRFEDTCAYRRLSEISSPEELELDIDEGYEKLVEKKKENWTESKWRIKRWFGRITHLDTKTEYVWKNGKISWQPIREYMTKLTAEYTNVFDTIQKQYKEEIQTAKKNAATMLEDLKRDLKDCQTEISIQDSYIREYSRNINKLEKETKRYSKEEQWLNELIKKIEGI